MSQFMGDRLNSLLFAKPIGNLDNGSLEGKANRRGRMLFSIYTAFFITNHFHFDVPDIGSRLAK
jgi:hypothetical protein